MVPIGLRALDRSANIQWCDHLAARMRNLLELPAGFQGKGSAPQRLARRQGPAAGAALEHTHVQIGQRQVLCTLWQCLQHECGHVSE
jgi:hypothetical protein